jgi:transposase InsO family protein
MQDIVAWAEPLGPATAPNSVWCIDFKGKFKTGDGEWCTPFTITDTYSRFCIRCELVEEPRRARRRAHPRCRVLRVRASCGDSE